MPRPQADDESLPTAIEPDMDTLFRTFHPRVYAYIRYRVANVNEAEDLTSEIMERALTHLTSYDERKGAFSTWLFRIAHNTWVNQLRKQQRHGKVQVQMGKEIDDLKDQELLPEDFVIQKEEIVRMLECMNRLPFRQQEVLTLRFAGQLKNKEIAQVLKMNERTVSVTLLRALRKLRQQLLEPKQE